MGNNSLLSDSPISACGSFQAVQHCWQGHKTHQRPTHNTHLVQREKKPAVHLSAEAPRLESRTAQTGDCWSQQLLHNRTSETQTVQMFSSRIPSAPGSAFVGHPGVNLCVATASAERHFRWQDLIELPFGGGTAPCLGTSAWQCLLSGGNCYPGLPYTVYTLRSILRHARPPLALLAYTQDFMMFTLYIQESA